MDVSRLAKALRRVLDADAVITDEQELRTYACDGLTSHAAVPGLAVLPHDTEQVAAVVRLCDAEGIPFVARGSGTGLSGGALPRTDGVLIVTSRMRRVLSVDVDNREATVEPGVVNLAVTRAASGAGFYYAPDPSSQQICSIGGNVAENSGGAHCLKYGFTVNHVLGLEIVTPRGDIAHLDARAPGYDLIGAFVGSEGTLGIATKVTVRLLRVPSKVVTLLAAFDTVDAAGECVSSVIAGGVLPAAMEIMDAMSIAAAEGAVACGYPAGAGAVLIVEVDGPDAEVDAQRAAVEGLARDAGAFEIRAAADAAQRAAIWKGRKSAFAAVGVLSPDYIVQDGVVPRSALPQVLRGIQRLSRDSGIRVANVFHAGDGNLHPLVLYDSAVEGETQRAEEVSGAILDECLANGGSITGEHGVGVDKSRYMPKMFSETDLDTMQLLRCAFDPRGICNPGKVFPTPRLCGEAPGKRRGVHPEVASGRAELF
ncbi:MAG TPA: FAD-linked oxidase C-terminal domain-containing protein [Stackebrandtia sp.]|uniref:FAD-linked oxidase C-terminal domain-containing protein n=1 Tax=Stackebrandtia sp. TaxID=2023065 RepID=UPI002D358914|nr:FAD-linked oxidase C-terminal domain-containing protein [Stackebrandtia sp.]HZE39617.1 FAD-linked oxidase C-terminal domain-containing protein [Stackebrandtia sp.]